LLLGASFALAKNDKEKFSKPLKAEKVKIEKKQILSKKDRALAEAMLKGKPATPPGLDKDKPEEVSDGGVTGVLGEPLAQGAQKYAILIGLSNYEGTANDLCVEPTAEDYPSNLCEDNDARNMEQALVENYSYDPENIYRFSDADADFYAIKAAVDYVTANASVDDEVVFFFSGHSATGQADDGDEETLDEGIVLYDHTVIWDGQLKEWFADLKTTRVLLAFDTCKAGGMDELEQDGRVIAMSSQELQYSYTYYLGGEDGQAGEGMFTHFFVKEGMIVGLADGYNPLKKKDKNKYDGDVAVEEAFKFSEKYVPSLTGNNQVPVLNDKFANDLLLGY